MLEARKNRIFNKIFALYNRNLIKRRFNALRVCGLETFEQDVGLPLLVYANHSSWWDGLIIYEISRRTRFDWFVMMEEKQLKRYFFFRWLGAFSVVRGDVEEALESIKYVAELMTQKKDVAVLIFPQGKIEPNDLRPIKIESGVASIIRRVREVATVPVALRYEFLGDFKPEVFVKIGELDVIDKPQSKSVLKKQMQNKLTSLLDELKTDIILSDLKKYKRLV